MYTDAEDIVGICHQATTGARLYIRNKPTLSPERMLHEDYDHKCSVAKNLVVTL
jgi:hypothetical protein